MTARTTPIVDAHEHICLIHYGETSRRPVLLQWALEAIAADEGVLLVDAPENADALLALIGDRRGRVVAVDAAKEFAASSDGRAAAERIVGALARQAGDARIRRVSSPASFALAEQGEEAYLDFERTLSRLVEDEPVSMMCQYDLVELDPDLVVLAAAEHSIVVQLDDLALPTLDLRPTPEGIKVSGEVDAANERLVRTWMSRHRGRPLVIDCASLTFLDVAGFRALTAVAAEDTPVTIVHANGVPATLLSALPGALGSPHISIGEAR
ncbi:MAG TPA: MEDS domain-containing protein [Actinomycetota bacterium]|nr:MEDS domain-containing protein [Actinomycetota bacterium]